VTIETIGWALVHSLWQAAVIALLAAIVFAVTSRRAPAVRYWTGLIALGAMAALPIATAMRMTSPDEIGTFEGILAPGSAQSNDLSAGEASSPALLEAAAEPAPAVSAGRPPFSVESLQPLAASLLPWIVAAWLVGLIVASARLLGGIARTRRMTRVGVTPASPAIEEAVARLASRLGVHRIVRILESTRTQVPLVIGAARPVIVIPVSLVTGLNPHQLDMLLAHELAHIRRYDFLVNIAQTVIETLLFYHPAARWLSERVREERENCCDDVAVEATGGNAREYTAALLALEESRSSDLGFAAAASGGSLLRRARRLVLGEPAHVELGPRWIAGIVTVAAALLTGREAVGLGVQASFTPGLVIETAAGDSIEKERKDRKGKGPDPSKARPGTVVKAPAGGTLAERFRWAENRSRGLGNSYWVGYVVAGDPRFRFYADDIPVYISDGGITVSGRMQFGDDGLTGLTFYGVPLAPVVGAHSPTSTAVMFLVSDGVTGRQIERMHVATFQIPVYFNLRPVIWLDSASDAESIALIQALAPRVKSADLKEDIVAAIGVHSSPDVVVPPLIGIMQSRTESEDLRAEAAEWLGKKNSPLAMSALSRAIRTDRSNEVRENAIESFSHMPVPSATDSLMSFATTLARSDNRQTAIEALGHRKERRVVDFLTRIATSATDEEEAEYAIEALGHMEDGAGFDAVTRIARTTRNAEIRQAAFEAIGHSKQGESLLASIVRGQQDDEQRVQALEAYADVVKESQAVAFLDGIMRTDRSHYVRTRALELLGDFDHAAAVAAVRRVAASNADPALRERAIEILNDR
jgi:beta-lactamase regulating signal transducer with metallopeptidase domain/HEAT repeat protein